MALLTVAWSSTALAQGAATRWQVGASGEARMVQHRVSAGNGLELSSGTLFGGSLMLGIGRYVELSASVVSGSLNADSVQADDATMARGEAHVAVLPAPWLAIRVGGARHTFTTDAAVQQWSTARLGAETRLRFIGGRLTGLVRFELYPVMSVSDLTKPNRGFGAASGLSLESGAVTASLLYELERYDFPVVAGVERHEQLGTLIATLGVRFRKG